MKNSLFGADLDESYTLLRERQKHINRYPLDGLKIERIAGFDYEDGVRKKSVGSYDKQFKLMQNRGWERSLTPQEAFELFDDYSQGSKKYPAKRLTVEGIIRGEGEFLCHAIQRDQKFVYISEYADDGLKYENEFNGYATDSLLDWYDKSEIFNVGKMEGIKTFKEINENCPVLLEYLCGMSYRELTDEIKAEGMIHLPPHGDIEIRPLVVSALGAYTISCNRNFYASRGVVVDK